ncbi:hypothetical protein I9W82_002095 [Candida metapsilosis]|uniref:Uncharacterized protein n=1 Tax=Candida metapsilosis TaxID=273372 RepID=A0A8H8DCT0_9ASCO|nr:hypothetical protein I9W82_002095 [Candida metapsilosis]
MLIFFFEFHLSALQETISIPRKRVPVTETISKGDDEKLIPRSPLDLAPAYKPCEVLMRLFESRVKLAHNEENKLCLVFNDILVEEYITIIIAFNAVSHLQFDNARVSSSIKCSVNGCGAKANLNRGKALIVLNHNHDIDIFKGIVTKDVSSLVIQGYSYHEVLSGALIQSQLVPSDTYKHTRTIFKQSSKLINNYERYLYCNRKLRLDLPGIGKMEGSMGYYLLEQTVKNKEEIYVFNMLQLQVIKERSRLNGYILLNEKRVLGIAFTATLEQCLKVIRQDIIKKKIKLITEYSDEADRIIKENSNVYMNYIGLGVDTKSSVAFDEFKEQLKKGRIGGQVPTVATERIVFKDYN